jgi:carboxylesterase
MLRFIGDVERQAQRAKPAAKSITLIDNPSDDVVDNRASAALLARWRQHGGQVRNLHFPAEWNLLHDLIDPDQPEQQVERVYPLLLRLLEE